MGLVFATCVLMLLRKVCRAETDAAQPRPLLVCPVLHREAESLDQLQLGLLLPLDVHSCLSSLCQAGLGALGMKEAQSLASPTQGRFAIGWNTPCWTGGLPSEETLLLTLCLRLVRSSLK